MMVLGGDFNARTDPLVRDRTKSASMFRRETPRAAHTVTRWSHFAEPRALA